MKSKIKAFLKEEKGDFGVKYIAMTVAVIVLIGVAITVIGDNLGTWIPNIWDMFIEKIKTLMS